MNALLPMLVACASQVVTIGEDDSVSLTVPVTGDDTGAVVDTASEATGGEVSAAAVDLTRWSGTRRFYYDASELGYYCDETIVEQGLEVPAGTGVRALLQEACPACSHLYESIGDRDEVCGWIDLDELSWRGIEFRGDTTIVHLWYADDGDLVEFTVAQANFDGQFLHYDYTFQAWDGMDVGVSGTLAFAAQDAAP